MKQYEQPTILLFSLESADILTLSDAYEDDPFIEPFGDQL